VTARPWPGKRGGLVLAGTGWRPDNGRTGQRQSPRTSQRPPRRDL